jgi:hypothetical protein
MNAPLVPHPPVASVADFAQAYATGYAAKAATNNRANIVGGANLAPVAPANLIAPTSVLIAAIPLTPKVSGFIAFYFNLIYTVSGAIGVSAAASTYEGQTGGLTGGTTTGGVIWESSPIAAPTGGANFATVGLYSQTDPAGGLTQTIMISGVAPMAPNVLGALLFSITTADNLSAMQLTAGAYELP